MYVYIYIYTCIYACICVCMCVCMCVYMCIYIYIYYTMYMIRSGEAFLDLYNVDPQASEQDPSHTSHDDEGPQVMFIHIHQLSRILYIYCFK